MVSKTTIITVAVVILTALCLTSVILWGVEVSKLASTPSSPHPPPSPPSPPASPTPAATPSAGPSEAIPAGIFCSLTSDWMSLPLNTSCGAQTVNWCIDWRNRASPACVFEGCSYLFYFDGLFTVGTGSTGSVVNGSISSLELAVQSDTNALYAGAIRNLIIDNAADSINPIVPAPIGLNESAFFNYSSDSDDFRVNARAFAQEATALRWSCLSFENFVSSGMSSEIFYYRFNSKPASNGCADTDFTDITWLFENRSVALDSLCKYVDFMFKVYILQDSGSGMASINALCDAFSPPALFCELFETDPFYTPNSLWDTAVTPNPYVDAFTIARAINLEFENCVGTSCFQAPPYNP